MNYICHNPEFVDEMSKMQYYPGLSDVEHLCVINQTIPSHELPLPEEMEGSIYAGRVRGVF